MKTILTLITVSLFISGCKASIGKGSDSTNPREKPGSVEWSEGAPKGEPYFDMTENPSFNELNGLWHNEKTGESKGVKYHEALFFKDGVLSQAMKCQKFGMTSYALTHAPIRIARNQISITKGYGYKGTAEDKSTGETLPCKAVLYQSSFFYQLSGRGMCISTKEDCQGEKSFYIHMRDTP